MSSCDMTPVVSVVMTAYNAGSWIEQAIRSILKQTLSDFELVIVDDGSTDDTVRIVRSINDERIRFHGRPHAGAATQSNYGLNLATSDVIARADADDEFAPDWLERLYRFLRTHDEIGVVSCSYGIIDGEGRQIAQRIMPVTHEEILQHFPMFCMLCHSGAMYRRSIVEEAGWYDETLESGIDVDLWLRLASLTRMHAIPIMLLNVRRNIPSLSMTRRNEQNAALIRAARRYLEKEVECGRIAPLEARCMLAKTLYYHGKHAECRGEWVLYMKQGGSIQKSVRYLAPILLLGPLLEVLRFHGILEKVTSPLRRLHFFRQYLAP